MSEAVPMYRVVMNHEGQYLLSPEDAPIPAHWTDTGKSGTYDECMAFIKESWTDQRPRQLREFMDSRGLGRQPLFLVVAPDGKQFKLFVSGRIEGFPDGSVVAINNTPKYSQLLLAHHEDMKQRAEAEAHDSTKHRARG